MIIVFFHVLYLIGKMVYENYQARLNKSNGSVDKDCMPASRCTTSMCKFASDPSTAYDDEDDDDSPRAPKFSPPAYIQRYLAVVKVLVDPRYQGKIKKVVDFGCSEMGFITHLKHTPGIEEILCVDVDRDTLECHKVKAIPLNADYLQNRPNPLTIHVLEGSVTQRDKRLANSDAVVAIELIEHLYPDTLMDFPYNVFGYIKPLVVAITTPNADFNVLFPRMKNEFRHWDHKFEWTREQFEDWAKNIVTRYPEYDVSFQGICPGPPGTEDLGCCSQMAIFTRVRLQENASIYGIEGLMKSVTCQEYPYRIDNRSDEEKILDEAAYHIRRFTQNNSECLEEYPLNKLLQNLEKFYISAETLREVLSAGAWMIIDRDEGPMIQCPALSTFSDYNLEIDNDDILDGNSAWPDFVPSPEQYEAGFGTWGEENVVSQQEEELWDDDYEIPASLVSPNNSEPVNNIVEAESFTTRNIDEEENIETLYGERWDDDYEISAPLECENDQEPIENVLEDEFSLTRSIDTEDFDGIEITNLSHIPSSFESIAPGRLSTFEEPSESHQDSLENSQIADNQNSSLECDKEAVIESKRSKKDIETIGRSSNLIKNPDSKKPNRSSIGEEISYEKTEELASLCSIYLESSCNDEYEVCPEITSSSFDCTSLEHSLENSMKLKNSSVTAEFPKTKENCLLKRLSLTSVSTREREKKPKFTSSPRPTLELWRDETTKSSTDEDPDNLVKSFSEISLRSNGDSSTTTSGTNSSTSFRTVKKWFPPEVDSMYRKRDEATLKGGNESADIDDERSEIREIDSLDSIVRNLSLPRLVPREFADCSNESKENRQGENIESGENLASYVDSIVETVAENLSVFKDKNSSTSSKIDEAGHSRIGENDDIIEMKSASPETPPDSWSPEIMDSGYPNTSSTQDMTPENDLSSIAQDRISDSESPSVAEAPRLGFHEHAEVENGDLANNNRDGEGNNMIAAIVENELDEDLQPLIDVLENDIENENDIYALENGFPMWLLRILERGNAAGRQAMRELRVPDGAIVQVDVNAAGDAGMPDLDEGIDSTSSENDSEVDNDDDDIDDDDDDEEEDDDDENIDEISSTESSEETNDWNISGDC